MNRLLLDIYEIDKYTNYNGWLRTCNNLPAGNGSSRDLNPNQRKWSYRAIGKRKESLPQEPWEPGVLETMTKAQVNDPKNVLKMVKGILKQEIGDKKHSNLKKNVDLIKKVLSSLKK